MSAVSSDISPERMLTTTEVAQMLGYHRRTILRWAETGMIRSWRPPGEQTHYRIPYSAYLEFYQRFMRLSAEEQARLAADTERASDTDDEE